jgi:hypothetical protein
LPVFLSLFFFIFLEFSSFSQLAKLWRELSRSSWALRTFVAWTQTRWIIIAIAVSISKQVEGKKGKKRIGGSFCGNFSKL